MKSVFTTVGVGLASILTGLFVGYSWLLGNWAASGSIWRLVLVSAPTNMMAAALFYYLLRFSASVVSDSVALIAVFMAVNLIITIGVGTSVAGTIDGGPSPAIGMHTFSWGASYAYGQVFHDVRKKVWL